MAEPQSASLLYIERVLGVQSILTSPGPDHRLFGTGPSPIGFVIPVSGLSHKATSWRECLSQEDADQLEKIVSATGWELSKIHILACDPQRLGSLTRSALEQELKRSVRWVVMGPTLVNFLWNGCLVADVRGHVLTLGESYLWPTYGVEEMKTQPALKREVWTDLKRAFQGFMLPVPPAGKSK